MADIKAYDDPIWEYVLATKLQQYIPCVRDWWEHVDQLDITGTGVYPIKADDAPPGLMYRATNTPVRSPIKNVQVFPFVPVSYLQITNVAGGANRMVSRVCADNFTIEEFTIVEKSNLPSTYHQGQFIAFVPTEILNGAKALGKWVYLTAPEMCALMQDKVTKPIKNKLIKYI